MKAALIQINISVMEDVLCALHEQLIEVKRYRKELNSEIDKLNAKLFGDDEVNVAITIQTYTEESEKCSKFLAKVRKKIKSLEQLQRTLKAELRASQSIEAWIVEDDTFWLEQAKIAQEGGYATPDSVDALFVSFPVGDE
jgi:uncharacterized coiled-coil DUF342 family protein